MNGIAGRRSLRPAERFIVYATFGVLWISGIAWLVLNSFFRAAGEFGPTLHPWQPALLLTHGLTSVAALFGIGWLAARHAAVNWESSLRRSSGAVFSVVLFLLCISGFALFFLSGDTAQRFSSISHEVIGIAFTAFAAEHWFFGRHKTSPR